MCGIWGVLSSKSIELDQNKLFNAFNQIKTRGPDKSILIQNSNYIIGFHRLAIIDTSIQGDQPFSHSYYYTNDSNEKILRTIYLIVNYTVFVRVITFDTYPSFWNRLYVFIFAAVLNTNVYL
jgi:hypothetical protein